VVMTSEWKTSRKMLGKRLHESVHLRQCRNSRRHFCSGILIIAILGYYHSNFRYVFVKGSAGLQAEIWRNFFDFYWILVVSSEY
jgi:hypothetical protein